MAWGSRSRGSHRPQEDVQAFFRLSLFNAILSAVHLTLQRGWLGLRGCNALRTGAGAARSLLASAGTVLPRATFGELTCVGHPLGDRFLKMSVSRSTTTSFSAISAGGSVPRARCGRACCQFAPEGGAAVPIEKPAAGFSCPPGHGERDSLPRRGDKIGHTSSPHSRNAGESSAAAQQAHQPAQLWSVSIRTVLNPHFLILFLADRRPGYHRSPGPRSARVRPPHWCVVWAQNAVRSGT